MCFGIGARGVGCGFFFLTSPFWVPDAFLLSSSFWVRPSCLDLFLESGEVFLGQGVVIRDVQVIPKSPQVFEPVEITLGLEGEWSNPFDSSEVYVRARVVGVGDTYTIVQGFYYQGYERKMEDDKEVLRAVGAPVWKLRFAPWNAGAYGIYLFAADRSSRVEHPKIGMRVTAGSLPSFVSISRDGRRFMVGRQVFFPVGITVKGLPHSGTFGLEERLQKFSRVGFNTCRVVIAGDGYALERDSLGTYDLRSAWRIDRLMDVVRQADLKVLLVLDDGEEWGKEWGRNPYNRVIGGVCERPDDFWASLQARLLYKRKLRYLIGRIGGYTNLLGIEFFDGLVPPDYWLVEMAQEAFGLHPYNALVGAPASAERAQRLPRSLGFSTLEMRWMEKPMEMASSLWDTLGRWSGAVEIPSREGVKPCIVVFQSGMPSEFHLRAGLWVSFLGGAGGVVLGDREPEGEGIKVFREVMRDWGWVQERGKRLSLVASPGVTVWGRGDAEGGVLYGVVESGDGEVVLGGLREGDYRVVIRDAGSGEEQYSGVARSRRGELEVFLPKSGLDVVVLYRRV